MPIGRYRCNENSEDVQVLKLLQSESATEKEWDDHVSDVHDFFGDTEWSGESEGVIYIGHDGELTNCPMGKFIVKSAEGKFSCWCEEEFNKHYVILEA